MDIIQIYNNYYKYIYNYALKLSCHPDDALDITQETFLTALNKIYTLKNEEAVSGWLRRICFNKFIDETRKNKYLIEIEDVTSLERDGLLLQNSQEAHPETDSYCFRRNKQSPKWLFFSYGQKINLKSKNSLLPS